MGDFYLNFLVRSVAGFVSHSENIIEICKIHDCWWFAVLS